jgi:hypothetical protein
MNGSVRQNCGQAFRLGLALAAAALAASGATVLAASAGVENFTSNIPILILQAERPGPVSEARDYESFKLQIYEPTKDKPASLSNAPTLTLRTGLRLHGQVSRKFPKLSYRLKLQDAAGRSASSALLGMPADADWVLQGPWLDKSLIRNSLSYDLAHAMGCVAMRTRVCELFMNTSVEPLTEADYIGVYQLTEHIERGEQRVNVAKVTSDEDSGPTLNSGYILAWDVGRGTYLPSWRSIQVRYPTQPSPAEIDWIDHDVSRFDQALKSSDFRDPVRGYAAYLDVDAWVNYILFEELIFNLDGYTRSFYLHKDLGGKIRPGPVWDHDLAMGHQFPGGTRFTDWWYIERNASHGWIPRLMADLAFAGRMSERWAALRKDVLSDAQINARIDAFAAPLLCGPADRNFQRWKVLDVKSPFKESRYITVATATYSEQLVELKKFFYQRAAWMDGALPRP